MRYKSLKYDTNLVTSPQKIEEIIEKNNLHWLIDSEFENAEIEIKNKTLIWHSGTFYSGNWHYGIWKSGDFWGTWENGIFEGGNMRGKFKSGIKSI